MIRSFGVRGRLLLAFLTISGFAVVAAIAAMYAFSRAGDVLEQITQRRLPPVLASLELSRQAERIVAAAPALLAASSQPEREQAYEVIAREIGRLGQLLDSLRAETDAGGLISVRIAPLVQGFEGNLDDLNFLVEQRLAIATQQADLLARFTGAVRSAQRDLGPGGMLLDAALDQWLADGGSAATLTRAEVDPCSSDRITDLMPLLPQRKAELLIASINDAYLRTAMTAASRDLGEQTVPD
jgi:hypothetical protein